MFHTVVRDGNYSSCRTRADRLSLAIGDLFVGGRLQPGYADEKYLANESRRVYKDGMTTEQMVLATFEEPIRAVREGEGRLRGGKGGPEKGD